MDVSVAFNVALFSALLISVIRIITGEGEVITRTNVRVAVGDRAELPCDFNDTFLVALTWKKGPDLESSEEVVRYFRQQLIPGADMRYNISSNYSLVLTDTMLNDSDTYWCQLTSDGIFQSPTNLTVVPEVTTRQPTTAPPTTKSATKAATTRRSLSRTTSSTNKAPLISEVPVNAESAPVKPTTTTQKTQPTEEVLPTKKGSQSKMEMSEHIPIIIGCSIGGLILLALVVLGCYFCFCKNKAPDGYSTPKPV